MSAVKSFALGFAILAIAAPSSPGDSIRPDAWRHRHHHDQDDHGRDHAGSMTAGDSPRLGESGLARNTTHQVGAENLALSPGGQGTPTSAVQSAPSSAPTTTTGGLTIGTSAGPGSWIAPTATPASPAATPVQAAPTPTAAAPAAASSVSSATPEVLINFSNGPFPEASSLTTGTPQAFTASPAFTHFFGPGGPTPTDVANFEAEVLSTIKSTYANAGLAITLTTNPNADAAHTMSVVSGASYSGNPAAIGITDVGNNGFSFIDKLGGEQTVDQLAVAVGHNLAHELMHAFGIANHPEQAGPYVDAATTTLQTLEDPSTGFSPAAASLLSTLDFHDVGDSVTAGAQKLDGDQVLVGAAAAVPEPATLAAWLAALGLLAARRGRRPA